MLVSKYILRPFEQTIFPMEPKIYMIQMVVFIYVVIMPIAKYGNLSTSHTAISDVDRVTLIVITNLMSNII